MNTHYINRPTPPDGETDPRFREVTPELLEDHGIEFWRPRGWTQIEASDELDWIGLGTIWRIAGSDNPDKKTLTLAVETRKG